MIGCMAKAKPISIDVGRQQRPRIYSGGGRISVWAGTANAIIWSAWADKNILVEGSRSR